MILWNFCAVCLNAPHFDRHPGAIPKVLAELVEGLASNASMRQVVEKALAPQKQMIERELQRVALQRGGKAR